MILKKFLNTNKKPFYLKGESVRPDWQRHLFNGTELDTTYLKIWENLEVKDIEDEGKCLIITLAGWDSYSYDEKKQRVRESYFKFSSWTDDALERTAVKHNMSVEQVKEIVNDSKKDN